MSIRDLQRCYKVFCLFVGCLLACFWQPSRPLTLYSWGEAREGVLFSLLVQAFVPQGSFPGCKYLFNHSQKNLAFSHSPHLELSDKLVGKKEKDSYTMEHDSAIR